MPTLSILGSAAEVSGVSSGSLVTPTIGPAGFTGTVVVNQTGGVTFAPDASGNGVYFQNCCANYNNAYYKFAEAPASGVSSIILHKGQISFTLKSRANMAQRALITSYQTVLDVRDGNTSNHLVNFTTQVSWGSLIFYYTVDGVNDWYYVPQGTEDTLFGSGVTMRVTMTWTGSSLNLYLNGTKVQSSPYTPPVANWTAASVLDLGAYEYLTFGGYDSCGDIISDFTVGQLIQQ